MADTVEPPSVAFAFGCPRNMADHATNESSYRDEQLVVWSEPAHVPLEFWFNQEIPGPYSCFDTLCRIAEAAPYRYVAHVWAAARSGHFTSEQLTYQFQEACAYGRLYVAKALHYSASDQLAFTMVHADDDYACKIACIRGWWRVAVWLESLNVWHAPAPVAFDTGIRMPDTLVFPAQCLAYCQACRWAGGLRQEWCMAVAVSIRSGCGTNTRVHPGHTKCTSIDVGVRHPQPLHSTI